jgi:DNA-binding CsgD family transcriptional regulator
VPAPVAEAVVGRRHEIETITTALGAIEAGAPGRIVEVVGEAGIGKSTVVAAILATARQRAATTWSAAPTLAESDLPWTGLALLLAGVDTTVLDGLASAQRDALLAATSSARRGEVEPEMVAFALTTLLDTVSAPEGDADRPLVVMIDDTQWLDRASAAAIAHALRRTPRRRCLVVLARRVGEAMPFEPARLIDAGDHQVIELGGLSVAGLRQLLIDSHSIDMRRPDLARLHQRTGGNPLHALELARLLARGDSIDSTALPPSLRATLGARVTALPPDTLRVLKAAALLADPGVSKIQRVLPGIDVIEALAPAERERIATVRNDGRIEHGGVRGDVVVFDHPLHAAAAVDSMTTAERRTLHGAIAAVSDDDVERALHLGASRGEPDEHTAELLEAGGQRALERGSPDVAAELFRRSIDLTPGDPDDAAARHRRLYALADAQTTAGDHGDALDALTEIESSSSDADLLAKTLSLRVVAASNVEGPEAALRAAEAALAAGTDPEDRALQLMRITRLEQFNDLRRGLAAAERALAEAPEHLRAPFEIMLLGARVAAGLPVDVEPAITAAAEWTGSWSYLSTPQVLVELLVWTDHPMAVEHTERAIAKSVERGSRHYESDNLDQLGATLVVRGAWDAAERALRRSLDLQIDTDNADQNVGLAYILAASGRSDEAAQLIEAARRGMHDARSGRIRDVQVTARTGMIAFVTGDAAAADILVTAETIAIEVGLAAVRALPYRRDLVEALVVAGRLDEAAAAAERLAIDARRAELPSALADADAAAGLVAAARGDDDAAQTHFATAIEGHESCGLDYELARTLLAAGGAARRAGRRNDGRVHLERAKDLFNGMGATVWSRRCSDEIDRLGTRRSGQSDSALTPTEQQIAELVAAGRTNNEIASTLFVSVRTVESNLTRIYRKLGLRSRTELTRHLAG